MSEINAQHIFTLFINYNCVGGHPLIRDSRILVKLFLKNSCPAFLDRINTCTDCAAMPIQG